jgi:translation initiation factor SUI1
MDGVLNLAGQKTGFDEAQDDQVIPAGLGKGVIHISIQQRNARKSITKVQGINPAVDLEKVLKALKKVF